MVKKILYQRMVLSEILIILPSDSFLSFLAARLTLFGSSNNGFGFVNSDMDISMTFHGYEVYDVDTKKAIKGVETILRGYRFASKVTAIHSAKVPIVKFCFKDPEIEADISLYNILAQRNTELLLMYSQIDERVKLLGYTLKLFAKVKILIFSFIFYLNVYSFSTSFSLSFLFHFLFNLLSHFLFHFLFHFLIYCPFHFLFHFLYDFVLSFVINLVVF